MSKELISDIAFIVHVNTACGTQVANTTSKEIIHMLEQSGYVLGRKATYTSDINMKPIRERGLELVQVIEK